MNKIRITTVLVIVAMVVTACVSWMEAKPVFQPSAAALFQPQRPVPDSSAARRVESGEVLGFADEYHTFGWLNIPYAAAPVDELRWRAPQAAPSWQGVRMAVEYGAPCLQYWGRLAGVGGKPGEVVGSEDCLSLNIWAPRSAGNSTPKPVMFWIHGGGNDSGTASLYQAHHLAGTQDVVVVTINYRLGLLGWLSHDAIRQTSANPEDASGNFGTLDIIAALKWVQRNVSAFGGDPDNVTIFGESAGGKNVYSLIASPLAKGLFHRAISQSGSADTTLKVLAEEFSDKEQGAPVSGLINSSNGLIASVLQSRYPKQSEAQIKARLLAMPAEQVMAMLRGMSGADLMKLASKNLNELEEIRVARVIRDGHVIPQQSILQLFEDPTLYNGVPMLLGSNRDEQKLFSSADPEFVDYKLGLFPRIKDPVRYEHVSAYISENWKAAAVDEPAKRLTQNSGPPVFAYRFDWDEGPNNWKADLPSLLGAAHGLEISFVFGDFKGGVPLGPLLSRANAPGRKALSESMMDYWGEFAHSGSPGKGRSGQQSEWHAWQQQGNNLMLLDTPSDGGTRMAEVRTNVADIKARIPGDDILSTQLEKCKAYAVLFLHGYMASDFWDAQEYQQLGCAEFPAIKFREG